MSRKDGLRLWFTWSDSPWSELCRVRVLSQVSHVAKVYQKPDHELESRIQIEIAS